MHGVTTLDELRSLEQPKQETSRRSKRARDEATLAGAGAASRPIWMRECNECGEQLHVRRTRCTACGAAQVSKRQCEATSAAQADAEEAAIGLASIGKASRASKAEPQQSPTPEMKLTEELKLKLARLRKLQFLLANPPIELLSPTESPSEADKKLDSMTENSEEDVVATKQRQCMTILATVCTTATAKDSNARK